MHHLFSEMNIWAVLVSAAAYFVLGSLWFSILFGNVWSKEVEKHGVKINQPTGKDIGIKMFQTFIGNLIAAVAMAILVHMSRSSTWQSGFHLGFICGIGFAAASIVIAYTWESRSFKLMAIDFGYPVVGITVCGVILSVWK